MMNSPSRPLVLATLMMGLYLIPQVHIQAQIVADVPTVASFTELQQVLDAAWVDRSTSALYPPGLTYTNSLPLIAIEAGFDPAFLSALQAGATPGGIALRKGIVREDLAGRLWFGAAATAQATTTFPDGYDPVQWVLDTFPPPPGVTGTALDDYIADRRLTRQAMAFSLIAAADVPAYEAELQARFAAAAAAASNLGEEDIGMIHVELTPPSGPMEILVRAPFWVDYLGVYETRDLINPFPWTPLGTVPHTFDPMAWSYPLPEDLRYVILANHSLDTDLDGIPDAVEQLTTGTDAALADSDGDGLSDYDEIYIYGSNPKSPQTNPGGPGDQVFYGLNATNHPPGNYVSGPVDLRFKTWRATRAKTGYPGFTREGTIFRKYSSQSIYPCYLQTNTVADVVDTEKEEIKRAITRYETPYSEVLYDPESGTLTTNYFPGVTVSSNSVEHVILPWPGVLPWLPQQFPPTNNVSWASPYDACNPSAYADLAEPYTDRLLLAKAGKDYQRARDWTTEPTWGQAMVHERPMPWNGSIQAYEKIDPYPVPAMVEDIWAASDAHRSYVHSGTNTDHTINAADLQGLVYQATSTNSIPPGFLQHCVVLAVHRAPPAPGQAEGAITNVVPYEVFLKPGGAIAESITFPVPPPIQEGSIELRVVTVDLDVDSSHDGKVDETISEDAQEKEFAAPLLYNNDRDGSLSAAPDFAPPGINGESDLLDLAPLVIRAAGNLPPGWELRLSIDPASASGICVFDRNDTNAVQVLGESVQSWVVTNTTADVVLGVEAYRPLSRPHTNDVVFTLALLDPAGQVVSSDEAKMRTLPFLLLPNTHDADIVYAADYVPEFLAALSNAVVAAGAEIKAIPSNWLGNNGEYDTWLQDHAEIGAVRGPGNGRPASMPQAWNLPRAFGTDLVFPRGLLGPDFGVFSHGDTNWVTSADSGGNLELIPPHQTPGGKQYPFGRVICGKEMQDEQKQFITDQRLQGPPLDEVSLSWLGVGHIDEVVSFVSKPGADWTKPFDGTNAFHVLIADTASAFALLDSLNRSFTGQPTVVEASALQRFGAGWTADEWKDGFVEITVGPGAGQVHQVAGNTADRIVLKRPWAAPIPATNSTFVVTARSAYRCLFFEGAEDLGAASPAAVNTLLDTTKNWTAGLWTNGYVRIVAGSGAGEARKIIANTATNLVLASAWTATPDASWRYVVVEKSKMYNVTTPGTGTPAFETVGEVLAKHRAFNATQQAEIDKVRTALTDQVANISFVEIPSVFWDRKRPEPEAFSLVPNMVNLLPLETHLVVANPFGPRDEAGNDLFLRDFKASMGNDYTVHAVDAWRYHDGEGAVHCATNVKRKNFSPSEGVIP